MAENRDDDLAYACINGTCDRPATMARLLTGCIQPVCDVCGQAMQRAGSEVVALRQALERARD